MGEIFVRTNVVAMTLDFLGGFPYSVATLVGSQESTNFGTATWNRFTSFQLTTTLGTTDGVYTVWAGVRGVQATNDQTWHALNFTLDRVPPRIAITNLLNGTNVSVSLAQVQGWASEPLASIVYDLTNADGLVTNQEAFITGQFVDTNLTAFTTNYFQAYDIFLAEGTNKFTFRATDLAGNTSTTNLTVILNSSNATNAPMVTVNWPDTNTPIAGTNFTLTGMVDDPTATVLVSGNGFTNLIATVERDGRFIVPGVPLLASNNTFVVNATNKAGLATTSLGGGGAPASVTITVDPVQSSQISHDLMTLTGTVSDTSKAVWVNGVQATVNGDGTWEAHDLPVDDDSGSMQLNISAYPEGSDPNATAPSGVQTPVVSLPPMVLSSGYTRKYFFWSNGSCGVSPNWNIDYKSWARGLGGYDISQTFESVGSGAGLHSYDDPWGTENYLPVAWANVLTSEGGGQYGYASECEATGSYYTSEEAQIESVQTTIEVVAGGTATPGQMQLIRLTASVSADAPVLGSAIKISGQAMTPTATNNYVGEFYLAMQAGSTKTLPISVSGVSSYSFDVHSEGYSPVIKVNGVTMSNESVAKGAQFCVGQFLTFTNSWKPTPLGLKSETNIWSFSGNFFNDGTNSFSGMTFPNCSSNYFANSSLLTNATTTAWWVSGGHDFPGTNYEVTLNKFLTFSNGQTLPINLKGRFNMFRPLSIISPFTNSVHVLTNALLPYDQLQFADYGGVNGIVFSNVITLPSEFSASTNKWVQIVSSATRKLEENSSIVHERTNFDSGPYLDTGFPYDAFVDSDHTVPADSPWLPLLLDYHRGEAADEFQMYMLFQPSNGMWIPLRVVNWSWGGSATNGFHWELESGTNHVISNVETESYPLWKGNITNNTWYPPTPPL